MTLLPDITDRAVYLLWEGDTGCAACCYSKTLMGVFASREAIYSVVASVEDWEIEEVFIE